MAMNIDQTSTTFENNVALFTPAKNVDSNKSDKKKVAFGDIKNAPLAPTSGEKATVKKVEIEMTKEDNENYEIDESCNLKPVDYFQAWIEKAALTDEEVNTWIKMINTPLYMDPSEERMPPKIEDPIEEEFYPESELEWEIPPPLPNSPSISPDSNSSLEYHSCDGNSEVEIEATPEDFYNDPEMSALNRSVFEFSSEFDDSFSM